MGKNKKEEYKINMYNIPKTLDDHPFFGLTLDKEQKELVDAVWSRKKKMYLIDSLAGSGKTLISVALGVLMVKYGIYDKIVYVTFPGIYEKTQGFLPGDLLEKSEPYFQPLYDALIELNEIPDHCCNTSIDAVEKGISYIDCAVSTYMRGINLKNSFVIIDEAENADLNTLAKVISRINDDCLAMVIGHAGQCDMYDKTQSGFTACIDYQTKYHPEMCESFELKTNHRGEISQYADLMLQEYNPPKYGFIYRTENLITGDIFVGYHKRTMNTEDIDDSWFFGDLNSVNINKEHRKDNIFREIVKYGKDNFKREIIAEYDSLERLKYEYDIYFWNVFSNVFNENKTKNGE